ncbi:putative ras-related protein rab-18 [Tilletiaria anomala UBC 951]|uniref:Putative ras-related protein rab-18 n=1 Tax=Tilletiaria anomala (strain ATCC 24038 / CBS 436.72 / UBC 951) TaxID=1037660 RepID=A0A066VJA9_TILAU|nr:putative ras-related protein rab-18 [Tilletiaria anomala UBC 951]KDN40363.1 putative ras-related protein rab-18 [Tilletiaria anomala UBC 951]
MANDIPTLKILLLGSSAVGKSSLLLRFTDDEFLPVEETSATIGVDYKQKSIEVNGRRFKLSIWDTAGQERFRSLVGSYYRGAQGVIMVYDVTVRETFNSLPMWFNELETFSTSSDIVKIVVGNKVDKESSRVITTEEGRAFAESKGCLFVEASAKKGQNVSGAFDELINKIISTPSLWQKTDAGQRRPGDRLPGTLPNEGRSGIISLAADPGGYVSYARENCSC